MSRRRRKSTTADDIISVVSLLPWWGALLLAVVSYLVFHALLQQKPPPVTPTSEVISHAFLTPFYAFGQFMAPLLCVIAAAVSFARSRHRGQLFQQVASSQAADAVDQLTWQDFEKLVAEAFQRDGFELFESAKRTTGISRFMHIFSISTASVLLLGGCGPHNFDECMRSGLKDAHTNLALEILYMSCSDKFPGQTSHKGSSTRSTETPSAQTSPVDATHQDLPTSETARITGSASYDQQKNQVEGTFQNNSSWVITTIRASIEVADEQTGEIFGDPTLDFRLPSPINPCSSAGFFVNALTSYPMIATKASTAAAVKSWSIIQAWGYPTGKTYQCHALNASSAPTKQSRPKNEDGQIRISRGPPSTNQTTQKAPLCIYKTIMTNDDYKHCGLTPPGQ